MGGHFSHVGLEPWLHGSHQGPSPSSSAPGSGSLEGPGEDQWYLTGLQRASEKALLTVLTWRAEIWG